MFAIGLSGVFSLGGWCRLLQTGFLRSRPTQDPPTCGLLAGTGLSPSADGLPRPFPFANFHDVGVLQPRRRRNAAGLGSSPFARHYLGNHVCFLFLRVLRCFSSPRSPPCLAWMTGRQPAGLPHSEIPGSRVVCTSPGLIAAYHVFRRLPEPRHPPCALSYFRHTGGAETPPTYTFSFLRNYKSLELLLIFFLVQ